MEDGSAHCCVFSALNQYTGLRWQRSSSHSMSKATNPEGNPCFLKRFHALASDDQNKRFLASMAAVRVLDHDSILRPTGYFVENNDYFLEMPCCAGGTLTEWLSQRSRSLTERHGVAVRLVAVLLYMHSQGEWPQLS
jgi:serine/threonine protein kinase